MSFYPSITPVSVANIPSKEKLLETMVPLIEESESWPLGTKYEEKQWHLATQTFWRSRTARDGAAWHGRVSEHSKESIGGFEPFWNGLGVNHSPNEKEWSPELDDVKLLKTINDDQEIWALHYALRPPASNRLFTVLFTIHLTTDESTGLRTGYVLSIPVDVTSDHSLASQEYQATRGYYSAISRVRELPDGGVNWRVITTSTPGGMIPQWIADRAMPGKIKEDVPSYLAWLTKRDGATSSS